MTACAQRPAVPSREANSPGPPPAPTQPDATPEPTARCSPSRFETTDDGITWRVGDAKIPLSVSQRNGEHRYNYTNRTVRIEAPATPGVFLEASCYTETDCGAEKDADGNDRWCLVSHGLSGASTWFGLVAEHRPCESPLELLEAFALHAPSPTCLREALPTYPGALYETTEPYDRMVEAGVPAEVVASLDRHAKAAMDADRGYNDPGDNAKAAEALRALRELIAPHTQGEAAWGLDLLAARALARLEGRYPNTLVGRGNRYYDVGGAGGEEIRETDAAWADRPAR